MLELDSPSPLLGLVLAQVEEEDAVRRRQTDVGTLAPVNAEIFRGAPAAAAGRAVAVAARFAILLGLGAAERHAGVGVPIADDGLALRQGLGQGRRRLPPVGAEQQVDRPVVEVGAGLEVPVDELADLGGPVGEAEGDGRHGQGEQVLEEEGALGRLAAAVHALQEDEGAAAPRGAEAGNIRAEARPADRRRNVRFARRGDRPRARRRDRGVDDAHDAHDRHAAAAEGSDDASPRGDALRPRAAADG